MGIYTWRCLTWRASLDATPICVEKGEIPGTVRSIDSGQKDVSASFSVTKDLGWSPK